MDAMETLTKADLSKHLMEQLQLSKKDADLMVNAFLQSVVAALRLLQLLLTVRKAVIVLLP